MSSNESNEDSEDIDTKLEAAAIKVTRTATEKKSLLDIIAEIIVEGSTAVKPSPVTSQQTPTKSTLIAPKGSSKRKGATSIGATASEEPKQKYIRPIQPKEVVPAGTPPTSPTPSKRKRQSAVPLQGSLKDHLRSSTKK